MLPNTSPKGLVHPGELKNHENSEFERLRGSAGRDILSIPIDRGCLLKLGGSLPIKAWSVHNRHATMKRTVPLHQDIR